MIGVYMDDHGCTMHHNEPYGLTMVTLKLTRVGPGWLRPRISHQVSPIFAPYGVSRDKPGSINPLAMAHGCIVVLIAGHDPPDTQATSRC